MIANSSPPVIVVGAGPAGATAARSLALAGWPVWLLDRTASRYPARPFAVPESIRQVELCHVSYLRPVDGCPTYLEYFKEGDGIPSRLCPIHQGNLKQRVQAAVGSVFSGLGKKLKGLFGHH